MLLSPCHRPDGALEPAPLTALRAGGADSEWQGFWAGDDRYYARHEAPDGGVQWYRLHDEWRDIVAEDAAAPRARRSAAVLEIASSGAREDRGAPRAAGGRARVVLASRRRRT